MARLIFIYKDAFRYKRMSFLNLIKALFALLTQSFRLAICPVHKCRLDEGEAIAVSGMKRKSLDYKLASKESFPLARSVSNGCLAGVLPIFSNRVLYCAKCRQAEETWLKEASIDWQKAISLSPELSNLLKQQIDAQIEEQESKSKETPSKK